MKLILIWLQSVKYFGATEAPYSRRDVVMLFQVNGKKKEMKQKECVTGQKLDPAVLTVGRMLL